MSLLNFFKTPSRAIAAPIDQKDSHLDTLPNQLVSDGATPPGTGQPSATKPAANLLSTYGPLAANIQQDFGLSGREARFVMELAADGNASAAYVRAGFASKHPRSSAARLAAKANIHAALHHLRAKVADRIGFASEEALQLAADILRADVRELVEYQVGPCRFCHGDGELYQRTAGEMARDRLKHEALQERRRERNKDYKAEEFDEQGGDGYDLQLQPNTECKTCGGDGRGRVVVKDTRKISTAAAALYAGVKVSKDGVEVKIHDKIAILEKMFKYHGLYGKDNGQQAAAMDPAALIALSDAMERSREQRRAILAQRVQEGFTGD